MAKKKIVLGMSGGVDSSVAALLLKQQGYDVVGLFMRNWHEKDEFGHCTSEEDFDDVRRVANALDIPYYVVDLSKEYMEEVFSLFLTEYSKGRTPNPDVLCNKEIKFGHFKRYAESLGFDTLATGHYAGIEEKDGRIYLTRAVDEGKDQTYFLNQLSQQQLTNVVFPLASLTKEEVRKIALENNIPTATKKDSTGICFIGERHFRSFLSEYIPMKPGKIISLDGKELGTHNGVFYYTIGQRKGICLGGSGNGEPYFVVRKDVKNNILYVNQGECEELFSKKLIASNFNFITNPIQDGMRVLARTRHRQPLMQATANYIDSQTIKLTFDKPVRAITPGQYAVIYTDRVCLGGGVIE